ncbi:hypothetical protein [Weissella viridescens]|uniref:hypothetical protein n=1 Tax=Weissella viridescens TaxID=1629 RepID=UPI003AF26285
MNKTIGKVVLGMSAALFIGGIGFNQSGADAATVIQKRHVLNFNPAQQAGLTRAPWTQVHLHSTANTSATMQNEATYMARNYNAANYTHIVGWNYETGRAESWELMPKGGAYDLGGDWNWEGWASIEFSENIPNQAAFKQAYQAYIDTARQMANEVGANYALDDGTGIGLITHGSASVSGHGSDHNDPLPFLARWGVSKAQFARDLKTGVAFSGTSNQVKPTQPTKQKPTTNDVDYMRQYGEVAWNKKWFTINETTTISGLKQVYSNQLAGKTSNGYATKDEWLSNGIPVDGINRKGDKLQFKQNQMKIVDYDKATNGIAVKVNGYTVWVNATQARKA